MKPIQITRRQVLAASAAAAAMSIVPRHVLGGPGHTPPSEKLNIAGVGVGDQGGWDLAQLEGENIVALADVRLGLRGAHVRAVPTAPRNTKTSAKCSTRRRGSTPSSSARRTIITRSSRWRPSSGGKHVYCEKPLTRTIFEARALAKAARAQGRHADGKPGHGLRGNRLMTEWLEDGAIGAVREVHVWSDRPTHGGKMPLYWRKESSGQGAAARAPHARLGPLARPGASASLPSNLCSFPLAGLVGFRLRRAGRHGDSQHRPRLFFAEARRAGVRFRQFDGGICGDAASGLLCAVRVPRPRRHAPRHAALVRRRIVAAAAR